MITGTATVIDGDTIEIQVRRIRFHGIDAPESRQTCVADDAEWRCGQEAALALAELFGRSPVTCRERNVDRFPPELSVVPNAYEIADPA